MVYREGHLRHWLAAAKAKAVNSIIYPSNIVTDFGGYDTNRGHVAAMRRWKRS
jgi:hypothetical protein